jgi:hypothetical protein
VRDFARARSVGGEKSNSERETRNTELARRRTLEIRLISEGRLVLTRALLPAQPILAGTPYPMTSQHRFAENCPPDKAHLSTVGSKLAGAAGRGASRLTLIAVSRLTRAPDEAHLAKCFAPAKTDRQKTNS